MRSSDELVAKLRAGSAERIDLISPRSDAATAIVDARLAAPLDLARVPSYGDLSEGFRKLKVVRKDSTARLGGAGSRHAFAPRSGVGRC